MGRRTRAAPSRAERAAAWVAEAVSTGNPLAALPPDLAPRTRAEGERVALLALADLGIAPCGVRVCDGIAGPVVEGRMVPEGTPLAGLRHPRATAAVIGVLAAALEPGEDGAPALLPSAFSPPAFSMVRAALDVGDSRFSVPPQGVAGRSADLGGLGFVVIGVALGEAEGAAALAPAVAAARRMGGLPAGAVLVVAGLGEATRDGGLLRAGIAATPGTIGRDGAVTARLA